MNIAPFFYAQECTEEFAACATCAPRGEEGCSISCPNPVFPKSYDNPPIIN